jgi:hypothetical protein
MALAAYQVSFNGVTMGDGTNVDIVSLTGFDALPTINQSDIDRLRDWGQYSGSYFSTGRELVLSVEISDTTGSDTSFRTTIDAFAAAMQTQPDTELPFAVCLPGWAQASRQANVRVTDRQLVVDYPYTRHFATASVTFWATDPRIYDSTSTTVTASQPSLTGGTPWPIVWPAPWGSIVTGTAAVNVVNVGTFETRPVLTLTGPISNPSITNTGTGQSLTFQGLVLGGSDTLVVDFRAHTAIVNGSSNARGTLTAASAWFLFPPGTTSLVLTGGATTSGTQLSCTYQSAWM